MKRCATCLENYDPGHWAYGRDRCPACGGILVERRPSDGDAPYQPYDSSADVQFDLRGLLTPDQIRETRVLGWVGGLLLLLAGGGRLAYVVLARLEGFWDVPLWFDGLVGAMLLLGVVLLAWAARRFHVHRRVLRRGV